MTVAQPPTKRRKQTQDAMYSLYLSWRISASSYSETGSVLQKLDKGGIAYIWLPPTLNDRPSPVVITTSWAETLLASSDWEGKCINKHLFCMFQQIFRLSLPCSEWLCIARKCEACLNVSSVDLNMAETLAAQLRPSWGQRQGGFFGEGRPKHQLCSKPSLPKPRIIFLGRAQL